MQHRNDKTLHWYIENGRGMMEMADAVKARPINRTQRAPEIYGRERETVGTKIP